MQVAQVSWIVNYNSDLPAVIFSLKLASAVMNIKKVDEYHYHYKYDWVKEVAENKDFFIGLEPQKWSVISEHMNY